MNEAVPFVGKPGMLTETRDKLRRVAKYQRWVLLCLLANIIIVSLVFARAFGAMVFPEPGVWAIQILNLAISLFGLVAIVLLTKQFIGIGMTIVCAILMLVPVASLIVLLVINQKATRYLQQHGVRVGLLGADPNGI